MRVAVIPARGGSERIPRKNVKLFFGKPIIAYALETAIKSGLFTRILVSTEDAIIADIAMKYGATGIIERPPELCKQHVGTQEVAKHAIERWEPEDPATEVCCIYATSPLMSAQDLVRGSQILNQLGANFAFAVGTEPLVDAGMFYFGRVDAFRNDLPLYAERSVMVPIPKERVCDINTPEDFERCENMYRLLLEDGE